MNLGETKVLVDIKLNNLYPENKEWLKNQGFKISPISSNYVKDDGNLKISWEN